MAINAHKVQYLNKGRIDSMIEDITGLIREVLHEVGGEYDLTANPYSFTTVWLEGDEVWWDKDYSETPIRMGELTELCALYDTIMKTMKEIDNENA